MIVDDYENGQLETLSIGDYGKEKNVKADFLGYTNEINGVPNGKIKPLQEKWVMTLSTQYGCQMTCRFCDCPKIKFKGNASVSDFVNQFGNARNSYPDITYTDRLNIHFARMGEPLFNYDNIEIFTKLIHKCKMQNDLFGLQAETIHPVLTTMCPAELSNLRDIYKWVIDIKNGLYQGQAGLQISINSTNEEQRQKMFNGCAMTLEEIAEYLQNLPNPIGRKYCLNFAYSSEFEIDALKLKKYFDQSEWMIKITPIHNNSSCKNNGYETIDGYNDYKAYRKVEQDLIDAGFDVLVFVPSMDEENGLITCGNAILSGSEITV